MYPMTEADENNLRVLTARMRDEDPAGFIAILMDTLLFKFHDDSIAGIRRKDAGGEIDALIVVFKGAQPARWAETALEDLQRKLADLQGKRPPDGETGAG